MRLAWRKELVSLTFNTSLLQYDFQNYIVYEIHTNSDSLILMKNVFCTS
jgi:hypothetical protein